MDIRKISIGPDYKNAMSYLQGQEVLGGSHKIHLIFFDSSKDSIKIWIENDSNETLLWKEFNSNMPVSIEYNINF
jgi:hypothetical protein